MIERKYLTARASGLLDVYCPAYEALIAYPNSYEDQLAYESKPQDPHISTCDRFVVYRMAGWQFNQEVLDQIKCAERYSKVVEYIDQ